MVLAAAFAALAAAATAQLLRSRAECRELEAAVVRLRRALSAAEHEAMTDPLTGVHNRRVLDDLLSREVRRAERLGRPFTVLVIDIDGLKKVNDRAGHALGDDVLRALARAALGSIRGYDVVARVGGDEFVVVLHDTDRDAALATARRIRHQAEQAFAEAEAPDGTTVSIGAATWAAGRTAAALLAEADASMYATKRARRQEVARA